MKILMVAIPNHHFFQWVNQLKDAGHEVFWFDITDGGPAVDKISWVRQIKGWKLKWDFPFRNSIKANFPKIYAYFQKYNERDVAMVFEQKLKEIQPNMVHCFEMKLAGLPILPVMEKYPNIPLIYSSWGSDLFFFKEIGIAQQKVQRFFNRVNYLITDCKRDAQIAVENGFRANYLGVFPGNGGIAIPMDAIQKVEHRNSIVIKGYDDGVGKASVILKALELLPETFFKNRAIMIYSADESIIKQIRESHFLSNLAITIYARNSFLSNAALLKIMGESAIHIANSISDGMPNALLEAMGMGAFPIQSNPGNVTEEVIVHGKNGFLIADPLNEKAIAALIIEATENLELRKTAQAFNVEFIRQQYNRNTLKPKIIELYNQPIVSE